MSIRNQFVLGAVIAFCVGVIGGVISLKFGAPFLLGFLSGFVLTGMITFFVVAVGLENARTRK